MEPIRVVQLWARSLPGPAGAARSFMLLRPSVPGWQRGVASARASSRTRKQPWSRSKKVGAALLLAAGAEAVHFAMWRKRREFLSPISRCDMLPDAEYQAWFYNRLMRTGSECERMLRGTFLGVDPRELRREDVRGMLATGLMLGHAPERNAADAAVVDEVLQHLEKQLGWAFPPGRAGYEHMKFGANELDAWYHPLVITLANELAHALCHSLMRWSGFRVEHELNGVRFWVRHCAPGSVDVRAARAAAAADSAGAAGGEVRTVLATDATVPAPLPAPLPTPLPTPLPAPLPAPLPPVLVLHGFGLGLLPYVAFLRRLSERRTVICPEMPNIGLGHRAQRYPSAIDITMAVRSAVHRVLRAEATASTPAGAAASEGAESAAQAAGEAVEVDVVAHSYGTFVLSFLTKYLALPNEEVMRRKVTSAAADTAATVAAVSTAPVPDVAAVSVAAAVPAVVVGVGADEARAGGVIGALLDLPALGAALQRLPVVASAASSASTSAALPPPVRMRRRVYVDPVCFWADFSSSVSFPYVQLRTLLRDQRRTLRQRLHRLANVYFFAKDLETQHVCKRTLFGHESWERVSSLDHRCMVVLAERDRLVPSAAVHAFLRSEAPQVRVHMEPGLNHGGFLFEKSAPDVQAAIAEFLRGP